MSPETYTIDYELSDADENVHHVWDNGLDPVCTVEPGEVVRFECRDALDGQVGPDSTAEDLANASFDPVHPLTGPVAVEGATPGDVLAVELLDFEHKGWGFTGFMPGEMGLGLLPEEFPEAGLHIWELEDDVAHFVDGIEVPLDPFPGIVGVAPAEDGDHDTNPPRSVGGNLDIKHLTAGSTLFLPIDVEGALFSIGDCHAAQGDGEVCVSGIEAPMAVTCRLSGRKDRDLESPRFETAGPFAPAGLDGRAVGTTGVGDDLYEATRTAIRGMIEYLHDERGLAHELAYVLCSAAVDLKINQVVNVPNWTVSAYLPERIFPETDRME